MQRIVILGAGFAGIHAAQRIGKFIHTAHLEKNYEVVLVDRNEHHTYTPLLYEAATTSKEVASMTCLHEVVAYHLADLLGKLPVRIVHGNVIGVNSDQKVVMMNDQSLVSFDYLLIALGAETNDFGIPGIKDYGLTLKSFRDAITIRDRIWDYALEEKNLIRIVIGGGGSTGVEVAGEIKALCGEIEQVFPKCTLEATIVEASPHILSGFNPRVVRKVAARLTFLDVHLVTGKKIVAVREHEVLLDDHTGIPYDMFIWTGGIKSPSIFDSVPLQKGKDGRLLVTDQMACINISGAKSERIYAAGDATYFVNPRTEKSIPQVARAAISEGGVAAKNIIARVAAAEKMQKLRSYSYHPMAYPYVIPVGGKYAVFNIGGVIISGFLAWVLKGCIELNYLLSIMPVSHALEIWFKGLKIFIQNDRLG